MKKISKFSVGFILVFTLIILTSCQFPSHLSEKNTNLTSGNVIGVLENGEENDEEEGVMFKNSYPIEIPCLLPMMGMVLIIEPMMDTLQLIIKVVTPLELTNFPKRQKYKSNQELLSKMIQHYLITGGVINFKDFLF